MAPFGIHKALIIVLLAPWPAQLANAEKMKLPPMTWRYDFDGIEATLHGVTGFGTPQKPAVAITLSCSAKELSVVVYSDKIPDIGNRIASGVSTILIGDATIENPWLETPNFKSAVSWFRNGVIVNSLPMGIAGEDKPQRISSKQFFGLIETIHSGNILDANIQLVDDSRKYQRNVVLQFLAGTLSDNQRRSAGALHSRCKDLSRQVN